LSPGARWRDLQKLVGFFSQEFVSDALHKIATIPGNFEKHPDGVMNTETIALVTLRKGTTA